MASETTAVAHSTPISLEEAGVCVNSHGGAIGMPQLCGEWMGNQIFWLLVTLVVIFFVLSRIALPRIAAVLAERQGTITNDIAAAEDLKVKAVEAEDAYNKALADARTNAHAIIAEAKAGMEAIGRALIVRINRNLDAGRASRADADISALTVAASEVFLAVGQ